MYITDLKAISPQLTFENELLEGKKTDHEGTIFGVIEPDYMELIPKGLLRRMGKAVRMGVGAGLPLINAHKDIDGIVMGTANGGLEDCIKFLNQIVEYEEGVLTPTNFVQSTPNAVAGQLALMGTNRGYNATYTNGGLAFENALLDALLLMEDGATKKILLGGLEEISEYNYNIDWQGEKYKEQHVTDAELLDSNTPGTVCGEGASMFILEKEATSYYALIEDVAQITYPTSDDLETCLNRMLERNGLNASDIDTVMLGYNGDSDHQFWYDLIAQTVLPQTNVLTFKNLTGDYRTCSAFALWLSAHILNDNQKMLPFIMKRKIHNKKASRILIYNHFDAVRHGFILLSSKQ